MSVALAYLGAALLAVATVPQAVKLLRTRSARDLGWGFVALNIAGIALFAARSAELGEVPFLAANLVTAGFWGLAGAVKLREP